MDLLPIQPNSTNKVGASLNLANDGGSKSNSGYINTRGKKNDEEGKDSKNYDEVTFSKSNNEEDTEDIEKTLLEKIYNLINKIKNFILKILGFKKVNVPNIYEKSTL